MNQCANILFRNCVSIFIRGKSLAFPVCYYLVWILAVSVGWKQNAREFVCHKCGVLELQGRKEKKWETRRWGAPRGIWERQIAVC